MELLKNLQRSRRDQANIVQEFREYNNIRYTFVRNLYHHYDMLHSVVPGSDITFDRQLELLQSSYIWNIYKHLT